MNTSNKMPSWAPEGRKVYCALRARRQLLIAFGLTLASCTEHPDLIVAHRDRNGHPEEWTRRISDTERQLAFDTNGDGRPDLIKTFRDSEVIEIERDRDYNRQTDLVQEYSHGVLPHEIHDAAGRLTRRIVRK